MSLYISLKFGCNKHEPKILYVANNYDDIMINTFREYLPDCVNKNNPDRYYSVETFEVNTESDNYYNWIPILDEENVTYYQMPPDESTYSCKTGYIIAIINNSTCRYFDMESIINCIDLI